MKRNDLSIGRVVEFRHGRRALIVSTNSNLRLQFLFASEGLIEPSDETMDFETLLSKVKPDYDVMKVYETKQPIRRLSDIENLNNLTVISEREKEFLLKEFTKESFRQADNDIAESYAGFDNYELFRSKKNYCSIIFPDLIKGVSDDTIKKAKNMFAKEVMDIVNGNKLLSESRLSFCCTQSGAQFEYGMHIKFSVEGTELVDEEGHNCFDVLFRANDERVERLMNPGNHIEGIEMIREAKEIMPGVVVIGLGQKGF